ncbi:M3 family peptidase [Nesterenkonia sp. E16_7]|uniref:M3 family metallopeptidase n=1 Tax=unclassified Nesterenkonia TaxID=2629769 RepID=UPI001A92914F|nr:MULTISPECIES: M3 family metallopeptidase [unclassified Nesterenkonia]MBO0595988.1 M3 family peptidase [Nesterenkonia sp. E16_10]MBO0599412.1 M3 family peptidase [Nesterenkonia sp. E16_7]
MEHTERPGATERPTTHQPPSQNPLLEDGPLDYGLVDLSRIHDEHWLPALHAGITAQREAVEVIAADDSPASVATVLHPLGLSHRLLSRVERAFSCMSSVHATPQRQQVQQELAQELAGHRDWLTLHPGLFRRLSALESALAQGQTSATPEQLRMLHKTLDAARAAGAGLAETTQAQLRAINLELTAAETAYEQLQRREAAAHAVHFTDLSELAGLGEQELAAAEAAAREAGHGGGALLPLNLPVQQGPLERMTLRESRRRLHQASTARGTLTDEAGRTTGAIGAQIALLRARRARMLGFEHHLDTVLPSRTAEDRASIETMLRTIADGASARLEAEIQTLREAGVVANGASGPGASSSSAELDPWDISFGFAAVAKQRSTDEAPGEGQDVPLQEALDRVFAAASRLYGITVVERDDLPGFAPGARSFEVFEDSAEQRPGAGIGLFLLDLFARPSKSGGAWMNSFSVASTLTGSSPVVINALNITAPAPGEEPALTPSAMRTLFHEFGHALHGLLAEAEFEELSATAVPRDNVEFPSQVNEIFQELFTGGLAEAGQAPAAEQLWGKGLSTFEHIAAVVLDLAWHTLSVEEAEAAAEDPEAFSAQALAAWGLDHPLVPPRYGTGFFKHIFAGSGYAAGYYSYLWAQVLAADASQWYREQLGTLEDTEQLDRALAAAGFQVRRELLARGNTRDPLESYRITFGRDPAMGALLHQLGL